MKISFISIQNLTTSAPYEEIGIGMLAACMRKENHEVQLSIIANQSTDIKSIIDFNPDLIGFSVYNKDVDDLIILSRLLKEQIPNVIICAGGVTPTYYFAELLPLARSVDFVIIGEGEKTFLEVVNHIHNKTFNQCKDQIHGIAYLQDGKVYQTPPQKYSVDMQTLPYLSRDFISKYKMKSAFVHGSRGCSKKCSFCCSRNFWSMNDCNGWKCKTVTSMVDEIEFLIKNYGIYSFTIQDASFEDGGIERMIDFANQLIERKIDISYRCNLRSESCKKISRNNFQLLAKSGLIGVFLGIESGNAQDLKLYGKTATVEDNIQAIKLLNDCGIIVNAGFININPYSTIPKLLENIAFLKEHLAFLLVMKLGTRLAVYRGTGLYNYFKKKGIYHGIFDGEDYEFTEKNMDKFAEHIKKLAQKLQLDSGFGKMMNYYQYLHFLENIKRRITDQTIHDQIDIVKSSISQSFGVINDMVISWYTQLVNIIEDWDERAADQITEKDLDLAVFYEEKNRVEHDFNNLIIKLNKECKKGLFVLQHYS